MLLEKLRQNQIKNVLLISIPKWIEAGTDSESLAYQNLLEFVQTGTSLKTSSIKKIKEANLDQFGPKDQDLIKFIQKVLSK